MNFLFFVLLSLSLCKLLNKIFFWKSGTKSYIFYSELLIFLFVLCGKNKYEKEKHALAYKKNTT